MNTKNKHSLNNAFNAKKQGKDTDLILKYIRKTIESNSGILIDEVRHYTDEQLYYFGLYHFTTTNKAICEALGIPVEAGTRYKRKFEKADELVSSISKMRCPVTTHWAKVLTTNPDKFNDKSML